LRLGDRKAFVDDGDGMAESGVGLISGNLLMVGDDDDADGGGAGLLYGCGYEKTIKCQLVSIGLRMTKRFCRSPRPAPTTSSCNRENFMRCSVSGREIRLEQGETRVRWALFTLWFECKKGSLMPTSHSNPNFRTAACRRAAVVRLEFNSYDGS
jgi:hypothetical protein